MQPLELVGLATTALLVGALVGGFVTARSARAARRAAHEERFIESLVQWLAARRAWRQSAEVLVRTARRLAQEPRQSLRFAKYCRTARAARRVFQRTTDQLVMAEAAMDVWRGDALGRLGDAPRQPTPGQVRRVALRGGAERIESLQRRLNLADPADIEWVRRERIQMRSRSSLLGLVGTWAQRFVWRVVRTWERPR
jgi:hypothetical protein